jgi:hypothetical protein
MSFYKFSFWNSCIASFIKFWLTPRQCLSCVLLVYIMHSFFHTSAPTIFVGVLDKDLSHKTRHSCSIKNCMVEVIGKRLTICNDRHILAEPCSVLQFPYNSIDIWSLVLLDCMPNFLNCWFVTLVSSNRYDTHYNRWCGNVGYQQF